ncbi:YadA-like family protein [Histophilus somni]|uniref:YadA-like family protein n=1 Tax=Histophilus somni TaxID=731 RepID=UPI001C4D0DE8|nr:YadA-like family protein [Histophilus somni]
MGDILGVSVNTPNNTQFDRYKFTAVDYKGSQKKQKTIFKDAIEELITAVNKGIVIQDADSHTGTLNLGSTLTIKAGNIDKPKSDVDGFSSDNIKTSYQPTRKELLIGIKDKPIFKEVTISGTVNDRSDKKTLTTKEYVDGKLANVATSFTVNGNMGNYIVQSALNIKGKADASQHKNITTEAKTNEKELEISLNKDLKDIASITGEGIKSGKNTVYSKIAFNSTNGSNATTNVTISSNGANYTFDRTGFDMSDRRITRLQSGLNTQHHGPKGANGNPENVSKILDGSYITTIKGNAVNVSDLSNVAKAIVEKGLKFAGDSGSEITRKLGEKLTIKGNGTDLTSKTDSNKGEITFTLHKATSIDDNTATNSNKDKVVTAGAVKTYLDSKIDEVSTTLGLEADNSKNSGPTGKVNLKNEKLKVAGTSDEIETKVEQDKQSITLSFAQNTKNKLGMITVDGDKLALGKNAKTVDKMTAPKEAKVTVGNDSLKFNWTGGVSADDKEQSKKSVISVGDTGKEHLITHVAAGKVEVNSTDAINGSQLYGVVDAFSKLAINVLGAKADLTSGFKKSSFDVVKYNGNTNTQTSKEMTFKDAIGQNTTAINKGFIFGVGDSNNEQGTHYLGDKLIIKAGAVDKPTSTSDDGYSPDNIKTAYLAKSKELLIGIKDKPTFKEVKVSGTVDDSSDGKTLTTKTYVDGKLANVAANFDVKGDNNVVYTLNKQNNVLNINGDTKNITTAVDKNAKKVSITLKEALTGITSIGKDTNNQIAFSDSGTILKAGGSSLNLTGSSGKVKISNVANGTSDNDAINKSQLNSVVSALGGEAKIGADGNVIAPSYTLANGNKAPYTTVGEALSALDEVLTSVNGAGITFSDGTTNNDFVRKNSENDKKVVIKSGSNINVSLSKTNSDKTGEFTVALNKDLEDINSITLKDSGGHSATNKTGKITIDGVTGDVKVQHGDGRASKIVIESGLNALTGNDEIQVTGGGKVFGNASLSLKDASIAGTKLKDNTIAEAKLDQGIKDKLNKTFMVKAEGATSDNLIGNTLEFAAKDSNLTVELDKSNKKISYGLSSTLTGIESIAKDKTKISLADTKIKLMPEEGAALTLTKSDTDKVKISGLGDGQIDGASNEAITGKQLHDLAGKLGVTVDNAKAGFTQPSFTKVNYQGQTETNGKTTFKEAINDLIVAVNKGLVVGDGTVKGTLQLGDTLQIKAGNIDKKSTSDDGFSSDNIKTSYQQNTKELLIGIKDKPSFKQVTVTEEINEKSPKTALTTKKYVDSKATQNEQAIANQEIKYKANGAGDNKVKLSEGLDFKNDDNITVTADAGGAITHKLNADLKNITSIAGKGDSGTAPKIDFANGDGLKISSKGTDLTLKADGLDLNNKQITGIASGLDQKMNGASGRQDLDELLKLVATGQPQNGGTSNDGKLNKAINAGDLLHIANELKNKGLSFQGNDGKDVTRKLGETLKIVGETSATTPTDSTQPAMETAPDNITVAKKTGNGDDTLEIKLSKNLKGIASIANGDKAKIALDKDKGTITFTAGDQARSKDVTLSAGKFSGVSEINKEEGKGALKLTENTATLESAKDNSKLELKDKAVTLESTKDGSSVTLDGTSATLSAGKNKGSIKVTNGADNKIELSPENGSTVMLKKDMTNGGVQATGLSTIGKDDDNALVFKNSTSGTDKTAELKVGGSALTFTKATTGNTVKISNVEDGKIDTSSTEAITGKQLHDLASKLGVEVESETGFKQPSFTAIKGGTSSTGGTTNSNTGPTTFKEAINQLITAVNGGLTFKGNDNGSSPSSTTLQLGGTLTIDSSTSKVKADGMAEATQKDITVSLAPSNGNNPQSAGTLTLKLNKATTVSETDEKVVTSKAVATKLKEYTTTAQLQTDFLKVDGSNIGDKKLALGKNVGIDTIKLGETEKSTTELVQADAVIKYLKGTGDKSVKVSDNPETKADGEGSIAIGDKAVAENEGAIAIGYDTSAKNRRSVAIGREAQVLGEHATAIGYKNNVSGNDSGAFGKDNEIIGKHSYAVGAYNKIEGDHVYALGSNITTTKDITNAVILGNKSTGVSNAVSVGGAGKDEQRRIVYVATPTDKYDAVNKKYVDDLTLSYKTNSDDKTKQSINLKTGALDFKKSENISVSVEADGKITHTLNNNLQEITSIKGGKDESGAKITLETAKKEISFNDSKLTNLADGEIGDSSKEAVTGKQLADLAKQLGIAVDTSDKTKFTAPTFDNFKLKDINGTDGTAPKNIVEGLKNAVSKLNEGLKFSADMPSAVANGTQSTPHYLGSTLSIVRLDMNQAGSSATPAPAGTSSQPNIAEFKGDNLITQYTREANGNAKIEIGFKNAPTFSKVMLAEEQTYNGVNGNSGSTDWKKELITKGYLEQALDKFKFKVENGSGKTIEIGRNDTLKFTSGQNIKVDLAKNGTTPSSTGSTSPSASAPAPTPAAPASVSSAAPSSSSGGAGSNGGGSNSMASSGGSNGAGMATTTPTSAPTTTPTTTTPTTTAVVTIGTTEELKNITSISSKPKAGSAGGSGTGSSAVGNQDEVTKLTLDAEKGATFQVGNQGTEVNINKDGISLTPQSKDGKATLNKDGLTVGDKEAANGDKTHTVYGKDGLTVKGKDSSKEVVSLKVADGENSQGNNGGNGQSATLAFAKIGNGSGAGTGADAKGTGTGKITGLADIKPDEKDGTLATNKNYVDGKVSDLNNNRPFDFYLNGEKVVKDKDGNFKKLKDGKPDQLLTEEEKKQVVIKAEPSTAPIGISNVASGLGITTPTKDEKKQLSELAEKVNEKVEALGEKAKTLSDTATKLADLELMVDSLKQTIDTLPDGEAKEKIRENLKKYETQLSDAQEAKKNAEEAVESARNELIEANGDYNAFSEAMAKVEELVEPDSQANLSNVATVGDLQAVARAGLNFVGNDDVTVHKNVGETLSITGEGTFNSNRTATGNIKVEMAQDGKGLEVKLSDQLKNMTSFETREVEGRKSTLDSNGLRVVNKGKDGTDDKAKSATYGAEAVVLEDKNKSDKAVITAGGIRFADSSTQTTALSTELNKNGLTVNGAGGQIHIDGTKGVITVPNIKPNADGHVVVNKNYVDTKNNELRTQMNNNDRNMRAGVAQAVAQANLPINILPGKSTLSLATGNYMGSQAFAVGYSRVSDNGKLSVKFSLGHGDKKTSVGAGVGYSW